MASHLRACDAQNNTAIARMHLKDAVRSAQQLMSDLQADLAALETTPAPAPKTASAKPAAKTATKVMA